MNINEIYRATLIDLKAGNRPQLKWNFTEINSLQHEIENQLNSPIDEQILEMIYCILSNSQTTAIVFHGSLLRSYQQIKNNDQLIIYFLSACSNQILTHAERTGDLPPTHFYEIIKELLAHKNPEVLEWTLRIISLMGPSSLKFKSDILNLKPKLHRIFNQHQRNAFLIVDDIINHWPKTKSSLK